MAWSWSHTTEAYVHAAEQVHHLSKKTLVVIYAEWKTHRPDEGPEHFDQAAYDTALKDARKLAHDILAEAVWEKAEAQALCTNGGWEAWLCPFGCCCHMVPFSPPKQNAA